MEITSVGWTSIISPFDLEFIPKRWGYEEIIFNSKQANYCMKRLFVEKDKYLSYHYHEIKDEVLLVHEGLVWFIYEDNGEPKKVKLSSGFSFHVQPYLKHQIYAIRDTMIYEASTFHSNDDSKRVTLDLVMKV